MSDFVTHGLYSPRLLCPWDSSDKILEWALIPFSRYLPDPGLDPGSPALQADSLPSELPNTSMEAWLLGRGLQCWPHPMLGAGGLVFCALV